MNQPADNNQTGRDKTGEKQFKHNLGRDSVISQPGNGSRLDAEKCGARP
jgi:hypothetical protein